MRIDRVTARWVIVLLVIAGLAWVEAALHGNHYYRLTYAACRNLPNNPYCSQWGEVALFRAIFVAAIGLALFVFNERRNAAP